jgi:cell division septation protein DedD
MSDNIPEKKTMKSGTSKRSRAGKERKPAGTPKLIIGAGLVIIVGALVLFGPRFSSDNSGIGEQHSVVVSAPDTNASVPDSSAVALANKGADNKPSHRPRSSSVDIASESKEIVAESPDGSGLSKSEAAVQDEKLAAAEVVKPAPKPKPKSVPETKIQPGTSGGWVVQVGAFGQAANADKEALRLQAKGWDARVRGKNTPDGSMVFHVQIGYFASRSDGTLFARQNKKTIPGAYAQHK